METYRANNLDSKCDWEFSVLNKDSFIGEAHISLVATLHPFVYCISKRVNILGGRTIENSVNSWGVYSQTFRVPDTDPSQIQMENSQIFLNKMLKGSQEGLPEIADPNQNIFVQTDLATPQVHMLFQRNSRFFQATFIVGTGIRTKRIERKSREAESPDPEKATNTEQELSSDDDDDELRMFCLGRGVEKVKHIKKERGSVEEKCILGVQSGSKKLFENLPFSRRTAIDGLVRIKFLSKKHNENKKGEKVGSTSAIVEKEEEEEEEDDNDHKKLLLRN